ncbi:hypothetical protein [Streptomyces sp. NPDC094032]|uniref:LppU/SCO3897 family protein n=1 Tax=Streptomyces sp. NPDC094032 TaxID=3155308 RepID=UPI00331DAC14
MTTPQPSDPFAAAPAQAPAPAPEKKGGALKKIGSAVVLLVVLLAVKLGLPYVTGDAPVHAKAGECVTVTGANDNPDVSTEDCSSGKAGLYKVVKAIDDTTDPEKCGELGESRLVQEWDAEEFVLCLDPVKK